MSDTLTSSKSRKYVIFTAVVLLCCCQTGMLVTPGNNKHEAVAVHSTGTHASTNRHACAIQEWSLVVL